jgi:spermidine/putrescine transport system ATP-binding protein
LSDSGTRGEIVLDGVTKLFGSVVAVHELDLTIPGGEFFSMLGPSGCGKTTTLRMIGGFEEPTAGRILLQGEDVTWVPPAKRNVNMVFQAYGLFPHMTVADNVAFGLKIKRIKRSEIGTRVAEALRMVRLEGLDERRPRQLSGGQQQRVALARALVNRPAALLLDEPLGALDLKLRKEMQLELKAIAADSATTFVYVTHDQEEALTMSDRIAVMNEGVVEQVAEPRELYEHPATPFVAGFIGTSNLLSLKVDERTGGTIAMRLDGGQRMLAPDPGTTASPVQITVRPEKVKLANGNVPDDCSLISGKVEDIVYLGSMTELIVRLATGEQLTVHQLNDEDDQAEAQVGDDVTLQWRLEHSYVIGSRPVSAGAAGS